MRPVLRAALVLPITTLAAICAPARAQDAEYLEGGLISWPWITVDPADPDHVRVWTAEDGSRIRYADIPDIDAVFASTPTLPTWEFQPIGGTSRSILRFIAIDPIDGTAGQSGIAVGDDGTWLWTPNAENSAVSWRPSTVTIDGMPTTQTFWHATLAKAAVGHEAWVVGGEGLIAYTDDAVDHVVQFTSCIFVDAPPPGRMLGIDIVDGEHAGAASGDMVSDGDDHQTIVGGLYHTDDGVHWYQSSITFTTSGGLPAKPPAECNFWKVEFAPGSSAIGYAVGGSASNSGALFRTDDGGKSWTQEFHECQNLGASGCGPLATCDLPYLTCDPTTLYHDKNGYIRANELYAVTVLSEDVALATGYGGQILKRDISNSGLRLWDDLTQACEHTTMPLWGLHSDGASQVWLTGSPEQIRVSPDAGASWTDLAMDRAWRLDGIATVSTGGATTDEVVWVAGQFGRIAVSTDGGTTWEPQRDGYATTGLPTLRAIAFYDDGDSDRGNDVGVAVGDPTAGPNPELTIVGTETGGESCGWDVRTSPAITAAAVLLDVDHSGIDPYASTIEPVFWAVGKKGNVVRSRDGGTTWEVVASSSLPSGSSVTWTGVAFSSVDDGWLVGDDGTTDGLCYRTSNGSESDPAQVDWDEVDGSKPQLLDVTAIGGQAYVLGADGYVGDVSGANIVALTAVSSPRGTLTIRYELDGSTPMLYVGGNYGEFWKGTWSSSTLSWSRLRSWTNSPIVDMAFVDHDLGYLLGGGGADVTELGSISSLVKYH